MKAKLLFGHSSNRTGRRRYELLVEAVTQAINKADPNSLLEFWSPADEYSLEVGTVVPRVAKAASQQEVRVILREELDHWFGGASSGASEIFDGAASTIWQAVLAFRQTV